MANRGRPKKTAAQKKAAAAANAKLQKEYAKLKKTKPDYLQGIDFNNYKALKKAHTKLVNEGRTTMTLPQFAYRVKDTQGSGSLSFSKAIKKETHKHTYVSPEEISKDNIIEALKKFNKYDHAVKLCKGPNGKFRSLKNTLEWSKVHNGFIFKSYMTYDSLTGAYSADSVEHTYKIDTDNSPADVYVVEV